MLPFVGRKSELQALCAGLAKAKMGKGSLFLLAGEPGIGKTTLANELGRLAKEDGFAAIVARSWEGGGAPDGGG